jgi:hypothetical protein
MRKAAVVGFAFLALACTHCSLLLYNDDELSGAPANGSPEAGTEGDADPLGDASSSSVDANAGDGADASTDAKKFPDGSTVWPVNGHAYQLVVVETEWDGAKIDSETRGGHLVTITGPTENEFVFGLVKANDAAWEILDNGVQLGPWIGCIQAPGSPEPAGGFAWVTGEPFVYEAFGTGQPDNVSGENACQYLANNGVRTAIWNDAHASYPTKAFIVEYE